jgi:hypothetical protein
MATRCREYIRPARAAVVLGPMFALLAGCVTITQPVNNASVGNPVVASVGFRSQYCGNFKVLLDSTDVTSQFSPSPPAQSQPTATFSSLAMGQHTLVASADTLQYWFLIPFCGSSSDSVTFTVSCSPF